MNTIGNKTTGASITTTTVIIGVIALAIGLVAGVTAAESGTGIFGARKTANATNQMSSTSSSNLMPGGRNGWNPFKQIQDMQAQMDQMFNQMSEQFRAEPGFHGFNVVPGYSLSLDVRDMKNQFEVQAFLPDTKLSDVKVSLQNNQTLKVDVSKQTIETSGPTNATTSVAEWGQYEQVVQLPEPVKASEMKIERKNHELIITLPKATVG